MIVHELDVVSVSVAPDETKPPLLVDPDRVLSAPIAAQRLQAIPGGTRKSSSRVTVSSRNSFLTARSATSRGARFGGLPAASSFVSLSRHDRIIFVRTIKRYVGQRADLQPGALKSILRQASLKD
jgi:hypothetical protein